MPQSVDSELTLSRRVFVKLTVAELLTIPLSSCNGLPFLGNNRSTDSPKTQTPDLTVPVTPSVRASTTPGVIPKEFIVNSSRALLPEFKQLSQDSSFVYWFYQQVIQGGSVFFLDYTEITNYLHPNGEVTIDKNPDGITIGRVNSDTEGMQVRRMPDLDDQYIDKAVPWVNAGEPFPFRSGVRTYGRDGYPRTWLTARYITDIDLYRKGVNPYVFDFKASPEQLSQAGDNRIIDFVAGRFGVDTPFIYPAYDDEYKPIEIPIQPKPF